MNRNDNFNNARRDKNDEFYTQRSDIEKEMQHYESHFKGKVVYCNCDDPRESNFFFYFSRNFERLGLKKLIIACYASDDATLFSKKDSKKAVYQIYTGDKNGSRCPDDNEIAVKKFKGDGDFRSAESIELLKDADIVVTNPPFSLFREYIAQLIEHKKKFIVVGNYGSVIYRSIWALVQANKLWLGNKPMGDDMLFNVSKEFAAWLQQNKKEGSGYRIVEGVVKGRAPATWFTNLNHKRRSDKIILVEKYKKAAYPKYDGFDAIEVSKTKNIPADYAGAMGVPISFLSKYNPKQFELVGMDTDFIKESGGDSDRFYLGGKRLYVRIVIRNKDLQKEQ